MSAVLRAVPAAVALVVIVAGVALADEPTIGGRLSVTPTAVVVTSTASLDQTVRLSADDGSVLTPATLDLPPGGTARVTVTGPATGTVSAAFAASGIEGEAVGVVLQAAFRSSTTPDNGPWWPLWPLVALVGGLAILGVVRRLVLRRYG